MFNYRSLLNIRLGFGALVVLVLIKLSATNHWILEPNRWLERAYSSQSLYDDYGDGVSS